MFNKLKDKLAEAASGPAGNAGGNAGGNIAANQPKQLGASKWAEFRLMPPPAMPLSASAVKQLQQVCDSLLGSETFSVTNSPVLCCEGKNYLYSQRPYWWETQPGCWERRDGHRNPDCEKPQGQKQLQDMAMAVHALSYGSIANLPKSAEYGQKAQQLLQVFFLDPETKMMPEVLYAQVCPGDKPLKGDKVFVVASRFLILVSQALRVLQVPPEMDQALRQWFQAQVQWMESSDQGAEAKASGNNITLWFYALVASHLAYVDPGRATQFSNDTMNQIISAHATPEVLFAPELERTRPRHYVIFTLEALNLIAGAPTTGQDAPPQPTVAYLRNALNYAQTVPLGNIEANTDDDPKYKAQLAWFDRTLSRWEGKGAPENDPDSAPWEGGWNGRARLAWALI